MFWRALGLCIVWCGVMWCEALLWFDLVVVWRGAVRSVAVRFVLGCGRVHCCAFWRRVGFCGGLGRAGRRVVGLLGGRCVVVPAEC